MTDLYEKLLLVNHIPAIQGIAGVQDLIKAFAYRGDRIMEMAKEFEYSFRWVLHGIREVIPNRNIYLYNRQDIWTFYNQKDKTLYCTLYGYRICKDCGNYRVMYRSNLQTAKYARCKKSLFEDYE